MINFTKHYFKEIFSNWEYKVPDNIYQAIYDFYALSLINPELIRDDELAYSFKESKKTIVDYIGMFLLEQIERAIIAEIPHYLWFRKPNALTDENYYPSHLKGDDKIKKMYKDYVKAFAVKNHNKDQKLSMELYKYSLIHDYNKIYTLTKEFLNKHNYSDFDLFRFGKALFADRSGWINDQYGGAAWEKIADIGLKVLDVKNEKDIGKKMALLDHVFDIEHNTGSIFTKNQNLDVYKIKGILDDKRDITNEMAYYHRISAGLKEPYIAAIKDLTGKTLESEQPKIDLEDMIIMVKSNPDKIKYIQKPPREVQQAAIDADPTAVLHIQKPDVEIMQQAINKDIDIFSKLKSADKNRLPKKFVYDLFGSNWVAPVKEPAIKL